MKKQSVHCNPFLQFAENVMMLLKENQLLFITNTNPYFVIKNLNTARAEIAVNNFRNALDALEMIDPTSTCGADAKQLIAQISSKVERQNEQNVSMEKFRINAIKEIAKAYYSQKIKLVSYNVIIH